MSPVPPLKPLPEGLDLARPDDRVIADILAQKAARPDYRDAKFITDDGGAADTARHVGLETIDVPLDEDGRKTSWRLPHEPDGRDKIINELRTRVAALEKQSPSVTIRVEKSGGGDIDTLSMEVIRFPPLAPVEVDQIVSQVMMMKPAATGFQRQSPHSHLDSALSHDPRLQMAAQFFSIYNQGGVWQPSKEDDIQDYTQRAYPEWIKKVRTFFSNIHNTLGAPNRMLLAVFSVENLGSCPATHALVTIEAVGGLQLKRVPSSDSDEATLVIEMPPPPVPPKGQFVKTIGDLLNLGAGRLTQPNSKSSWMLPGPPPLKSLSIQSARDEFQWRDRSSAVRWQADCTEFRHRGEPRRFKFLITAPEDLVESRNSAVKCTFEAANMPHPKVLTVPVSVTVTNGNTAFYATDILHRTYPLSFPVGQSTLEPPGM